MYFRIHTSFIQTFFHMICVSVLSRYYKIKSRMNWVPTLCLILLISATLISASDDDLHEDHVLVLNQDNFDSVIEANPFILVEFYALGCGACMQLAPEYSKAAKIIAQANSTIKLAKVDGVQEKELVNKHGIDGYPTLIYFRRGLTTLQYPGERRADKIVSWLMKRSAPAAITLKTPEEAIELIENNDVVTIGFFVGDDADDKIATYLSTAETTELSVFAITYEKSVIEQFHAKMNDIILFNKESEEEDLFGGQFTRHDIAKFVEVGSLPLIMKFTADTAIHLFRSFIKNHLILFLDENSPDTEKLIEDIKPIAKSCKGEIRFTAFDINNEDGKGLYTYFDVIEEDSFPTIRLIHFGNQFLRYRPTAIEVNIDTVTKFVNDYLGGNGAQYLRSEQLPEDWNRHPVHMLVAKNFESVIRDSTKDVLVFFFVPWCSHCQEFAPVYDRIGDAFKDIEDIVIAKIDASKNDFQDVTPHSFPTIVLFTKENIAIEYKGKRTFEAISLFLESEDFSQELVEDHNVPDEIDNKLLEENEADITQEDEMEYSSQLDESLYDLDYEDEHPSSDIPMKEEL